VAKLQLNKEELRGWKKTVGFIGLGDMGGQMARHIAASGIDLVVFDVRSEAVTRLEQYGARGADSIGAVAQGADIVCICVVDDEQLRAVATELLAIGRADQLLVVHSSVRPATMEWLQAEVEASDLAGVVDAPVSGGGPAAKAGTLVFITAGEVELVAQCLPLFSTYGARAYHLGKMGNGQAMKLVNNILLHTNHLIVLEALRLAKSFELPEDEVIEIASQSTGNSWVLQTWGVLDTLLTEHTKAGTDAVYGIFTKEQWNAILVGRERNVALPFTALAVELSRQLIEAREVELSGKVRVAATK
jgi:3-hydroxyisobutyrate dehydrogenase